MDEPTSPTSPDAEPDATGASAPTGPASRPDWVRRIERGLAKGFLAVTLAAALLLAALQLKVVATPVAQLVADLANPLDGTSLSIGEVQGSWVASLSLIDVTLTRVDSTTGETVEMAHVDTLSTRYDLSDLTGGQLTLRSVRVAGPRATLRQDADSTWDWLRVLPPASADTSTSSFIVRVEDAVLSRGRASARFYAPGRDSTASVEDLYLRLPELESNAALGGLGVRARLDTLGLRATVPGDSARVVFGTRFDLSPYRIRLDTLALDSRRSQVTGQGLARLPTDDGDRLSDVDLRISAEPLSFVDLTPLLPIAGLDPAEQLTGSLHVTGSGAKLQAELRTTFRDGGRADADATFTPRTEAPARDERFFFRRASQDTGPALQYDLDARIQNLTTSLIGPPDPATNRITARLQASLAGDVREELSGLLEMDVSDTRYASTRLDTLRLQSRLTNGVATYTLQGRINDASLRGEGQARAFADTPTYRVSAAVRDLDAEAFGAAGLRTDVNADVDLEGSGLASDDLSLSSRMTFQPSVVNDLTIENGEAEMRVVPDSASGRLSIVTTNGQVRLSGMSMLDGSERFRIDTAQVDGVDVASMLADTTQSRLQLTARASGRGFNPASMQLDGELDVADSYYGAVRVDSARSRISLEQGRLTSTLRAAINDGTIAVSARGRPFDPSIDVTLEDGVFSQIDVGKWLPESSLTSDLNGSFDATFRDASGRFEPTSIRASGAIRLDSSRVNDETLRSATVDASLENGASTLDARLELPTGTSTFRAAARPFASVPSAQIIDGTLQGLNVGRLAGIDGLDTDLSGALSGEARGRSLESMNAKTTLVLAESRINRAPLDSARLTLRVRQGKASVRLRSRLAGGSLAADGRLDTAPQDSTAAFSARSRGDSTRVQLQLDAQTLDLAALAGSDSTTARLDSLRWSFDGSGSTIASVRARTTLAARGVTAADLSVQSIDVRGQLDEGLLRVDTLLARSNAITATGGGVIGFQRGGDTESDFRFTAVATNIAPLRTLAGTQNLDADTASVDGRIYGAPGQLRFGLEGQVGGLVYDDLRLAAFSVRAAGRQGTDTFLGRLEATISANTFTASALQVDQTRLNVVYDSSLADVVLQTRIDDRRNARIEATVDPRTDRQFVTLRSLNATLNDSAWRLLQEATFFYGDAYRIRGLLLYSDDQQIAADGRLDPNGTQSLVATIENFRMESIADLAGVDGLGGPLDGTVSLSGPATAPRLDGRLSMDVTSDERSVGNLRVDVGYDSLRLDLNARLVHVGGQQLTASGYLPADLRLSTPTPVDVNERPVDLSLQTDRFPVDWIDPFLDPQLLRDPGGEVMADVQVGGTIGTPEVSGTAQLRDGEVSVYDLDVRYTRATADLSFDGGRVSLKNARVYDQSGGRLQGSGFINLAELTLGEYDLSLNARNFTAIDTRAYKDVRVDGDMTVTGTTLEPVVRGGITVIQGDIFYAETLSEAEAADLASVQLTERDRRLLEQRFSIRISEADTTTFDVYQATEMDMSVNIRRDTWLRSRANPELNIQFTGTLDLEKAAGEDARVFGAIDVVPERSTVRQFGQEFRIQEGTLSFNGNPEEPLLNFIAVYEKQSRQTNSTEVEITLSAQGRPEDLDLQLSSQPQMDTRNILSYLATGQPADQLLSGGGGSTTDLAENLAIGQLTSLAENFATSNVGLDVVRIQYEPDGGSYFVLGRYVTPRFYVAIEQPVSVNQNQQGSATSSLAPDLTLEYELTDNLLMRAQSRDQSLRFNLLFQYAY